MFEKRIILCKLRAWTMLGSNYDVNIWTLMQQNLMNPIPIYSPIFVNFLCSFYIYIYIYIYSLIPFLYVDKSRVLLNQSAEKAWVFPQTTHGTCIQCVQKCYSLNIPNLLQILCYSKGQTLFLFRLLNWNQYDIWVWSRFLNYTNICFAL